MLWRIAPCPGRGGVPSAQPRLARHYRDEIVPLRKFINNELVLRYNGMLASVWEVLRG